MELEEENDEDEWKGGKGEGTGIVFFLSHGFAIVFFTNMSVDYDYCDVHSPIMPISYIHQISNPHRDFPPPPS